MFPVLLELVVSEIASAAAIPPSVKAAQADATIEASLPADVPISLLDTLSFTTRTLLRDGLSLAASTVAAASSASAASPSSGNSTSFIQLITPSEIPTLPLQSFMPTQSTVVGCLLALTLYVVSWAALASNGEGPSEREVDLKLAKRHTLIGRVYAIFGVFMKLYQCGVFVMHALLNRAIPFRDCSVYLRGFSCAQMPDEWTVSTERYRRTALNNFGLEDKAAEFCLKLLARSGLGEQAARAEADYILGNCLDQLFASTGIKPRDVDILVVNCSLFCPTPSLAAMIINKYKMREDINSYNLAGMGCSAGLVSLHLAKDLLRTHPNSIAVVVSTELITQQIYTGTQTKMLLQNALFRSGGAAIALTNKSSDFAFGRVRYELEHTVRTTLAADNDAYSCVFQDEDELGHRGVKLEKSLMGVAGKAMNKNITRLGPKILPWSEQLKFGVNMIARQLDTKLRILDKLQSIGLVSPPPPPTAEELAKVESKKTTTGENETEPGAPVKKPRYKSRIPEYVPNFKTAVDHICIHAGGRAVIDAIQAGLNLTEEDVAPSRATLKRYGNTSSSSIWYEFQYCEQNRSIKKGDKIWQLGFGSGFKCNSSIWRKL